MTAYADENLRMAALQAGDVDLIEYVPWQSMGTVEADPNLKLDAVNGPFMFLMFNGRTGPFADARVRRATGFAIRREEIVRTAFFGRGAPLNGLPLPPGSEFYDERRANYWRYDPARARALLAEAGNPNGFTCKLLATAQYGMHKDTALIVQAHLAEVGIRCELLLPDWGGRVQMGQRGQYEICVHGTALDANDPDGLAPIIDGTLPPSYGRSLGVVTPGLAELLAAGRAEFDPAKRRAIYAEAETRALEDAPAVGLAWRSQGYGMRRTVQGFRNLPGALTIVSGVSLEETAIG
jgi:peptide/nickel transport system substrate-binding protein